MSLAQAPPDLPPWHPSEYGHPHPLLSDPCHGGLVSGFCSSDLSSRHQLPSDSTSRWTPLLRRTVPLTAARRGLAPPAHETCLAHNEGWHAMARGPTHSTTHAHTPTRPHGRTHAHESLMAHNGLDRVPSRASAADVPTFICDRRQDNRDNPHALIVSFKCPGCGHRHFHGWQKNEPVGVPQHRVAHCATSVFPHGYFIVLELPAATEVIA